MALMAVFTALSSAARDLSLRGPALRTEPVEIGGEMISKQQKNRNGFSAQVSQCGCVTWYSLGDFASSAQARRPRETHRSAVSFPIRPAR